MKIGLQISLAELSLIEFTSKDDLPELIDKT
jgi:hypothetical protein